MFGDAVWMGPVVPPLTERDPDLVLAEVLWREFESADPVQRQRPVVDEQVRLARARRIASRARLYLSWCVDQMHAYLDAGDPIGAAHWAQRAAHEVGYLDWLTSRIEGRPYLAGPSTRLPDTWTDTAHTTAASTIVATDTGGGAW